MTKFEFLGDLSRLIADLPEEDREQAMEYYEDYFADAGPDREQEIIHDFVSPEYIAAQIRESSQKKQSGSAAANVDVGLLSALANDAAQQGVDASVFDTTNINDKPQTAQPQQQMRQAAQPQQPQMQQMRQAAQPQQPQMQQMRQAAQPQMQQMRQAAQPQMQQMRQAAQPQQPQMQQMRQMAQSGLMQNAQVNNMRKSSGGIVIDDSELGDFTSDGEGNIVNPWEAKGKAENKDSKQVEQEKARAELKKETENSEFRRTNSGTGINELYEESDFGEVEIDPKKKTIVTAVLIATCPISIALIALAVLVFVGSIALTLCSIGAIAGSFAGCVLSLYVALMALTISKLGSILFFFGLALVLLTVGISLIFFVIFMIKQGISSLYFSLIGLFNKVKLMIRNYTIKK